MDDKIFGDASECYGSPSNLYIYLNPLHRSQMSSQFPSSDRIAFEDVIGNEARVLGWPNWWVLIRGLGEPLCFFKLVDSESLRNLEPSTDSTITFLHRSSCQRLGLHGLTRLVKICSNLGSAFSIMVQARSHSWK